MKRYMYVGAARHGLEPGDIVMTATEIDFRIPSVRWVRRLDGQEFKVLTDLLRPIKQESFTPRMRDM